MSKRLKSAKKRVRSTQKRKARNLAAKLAIKKALKATEKAILSKASSAAELLRKTVSVIDKAVERGILHRNTAARKKSRLAKKLNTLAA